MAHTALPWEVWKRQIVHVKGRNFKGEPNAYSVVIGPDYKNADELNLEVAIETYEPPTPDNARLIVTAVNNYGDLLEASKRILAAAKDAIGYRDDEHMTELEYAMSEVRAAIARAEEQK